MIRIAQSTDLAAIARLLVQVQDQHLAEYPHVFRAMTLLQAQAEIAAALAAGSYIVHEDDRVSGFAKWLVQDRPETAYTTAVRIVQIDQIGVDAGRRRQGIGQQLLEWVVQRARGLGAHRVQLDTWESNVIAHGAFRTAGFVPYHRRLWRLL